MFGVLIITGCGPVTPQVTPQPTETPIAATSTPMETSPALPDEPAVILVVGSEADEEALLSTRSALETLLAGSEYSFEVHDGLSSTLVTTNLRVVVGVGPGLDLAGLAAQNPSLQFIAVDNPDAAPSDNLSVVGDPVEDARRLAFMAGYLAALTSSDYKTGALIPGDLENSEDLAECFVIGARFFCGLCLPKYPPFNRFPQWETLPLENAPGGFEPAVDNMVNLGVENLYLHHSLLSPEIMTYLSEKGVKVISDGQPDVLRGNWMGTLIVDPAPGLTAIWSDVFSGTGGFKQPGSIRLVDLDAGLVSEGRYRLFEETLTDLEAGLISIEEVP
jgi:hypothetical protein